ncbi:MAG: phosphate ABC transporter permease subunit PstC [Lentimicrobium sp.]|jgi:phosphate transport system permease protein|nr:phosphate ABC transporter permease subunit PstC [Lentimicrobium sp.]
MELRRRIVDSFNGKWMLISLIILFILPLVIGTGLYLKSIPLLEHHSLRQLVFSTNWAPSQSSFGFWSFISGSLYVTLISFLLSLPFCLFAAIYLTQFSSRFLLRIMHPVIDILSGLPSVIYGVWGILIVVPFIGDYLAPALGTTSTGYSVLAGGSVLAVMCIPYSLNMLIEIFRTVPCGLREASLSLGATSWEAVKHVVIRGNYPGIIAAFGLGIAKAFGETIAVMMVVGNVVSNSFNPLDPAYPLPALIANNYGEMLSIPLYDSALMFAALVLFIIIVIINLIFRFLIHKTRKK